eukprot:3129258-Amphidinium_carterae.1
MVPPFSKSNQRKKTDVSRRPSSTRRWKLVPGLKFNCGNIFQEVRFDAFGRTWKSLLDLGVSKHGIQSRQK